MTVKQRLIDFIKFKGISTREFCRTIGVSETYVSSMRSSLQPDKLINIVKHYPDLNTIWLMTGFGDMINDKSDLSIVDRDKIVLLGAEVFKDKLIAMFASGEIVSANISNAKDDIIRDLTKQIVILENEIQVLKAQLAEYKK